MVKSNIQLSGDDQLLSPEQVAKSLRISMQTLYRLIWEQSIPSVRIGRSVRFKKTSILQYIDAHETLPITKKMRHRKKIDTLKNKKEPLSLNTKQINS